AIDDMREQLKFLLPENAITLHGMAHLRHLPRYVRQSVVAIAPGLAEYANLRAELKQWEGPAIDDMREQLKFLLPENAITLHGMAHLRHLPRYV
ncbi:DUF3418 domain-containing protein, partial [Bacteroides fragilis]|nr:DUF3418 domain-containing protein [Bacteroides fragilis]